MDKNLKWHFVQLAEEMKTGLIIRSWGILLAIIIIIARENIENSIEPAKVKVNQ